MNPEELETYIIVRDWQPGQAFRLVILRPGQWRPGAPLPSDAFNIIVQPVEYRVTDTPAYAGVIEQIFEEEEEEEE